MSNLTHGWSRVVLDIGVAYKEDVDRVIEVLIELAKGMQEDPEFGELMISDPEILGVDAFEASSVTIKLLIQTLPLKQWLVKREFLRRTKNRFDELDIEIPFPHRTIYHRNAMDIVSQLTHRDSSGDEQKPEEKEVEEKEYQN